MGTKVVFFVENVAVYWFIRNSRFIFHVCIMGYTFYNSPAEKTRSSEKFKRRIFFFSASGNWTQVSLRGRVFEIFEIQVFSRNIVFGGKGAIWNLARESEKVGELILIGFVKTGIRRRFELRFVIYTEKNIYWLKLFHDYNLVVGKFTRKQFLWVNTLTEMSKEGKHSVIQFRRHNIPRSARYRSWRSFL